MKLFCKKKDFLNWKKLILFLTNFLIDFLFSNYTDFLIKNLIFLYRIECNLFYSLFLISMKNPKLTLG